MSTWKTFATSLSMSYVVMIPIVWVRALVLLKYVDWFVEPVVRVPHIPVTVAMGLVLLPDVWRGPPRKEDAVDANLAGFATVTVQSLLESLMLWVLGALVFAAGRVAGFISTP